MAELFTDIRYGGHERNLFDIAFPENARGDIDLVLMIHGGGWIGGDKDCYRNEIQGFAESGVVSASMSYRYISESSDGLDILDDITAAMNKIKEMCAEKGINTEKALLTGLSAGGHLSLLYGYSRVDEAPIKPAAVVSLSGPTDMVSEEAVDKFIHGNDMGDEAFVLSLVSNLCGMKLTLEDRTSETALAAAERISPLYYVNKNTVPTVICHAEHDTIVPFCNAVSLEKALAENGVEHEFVIYPTSGHCLESDPDCTAKTEALTAEYIKKYLKVFSK